MFTIDRGAVRGALGVFVLAAIAGDARGQIIDDFSSGSDAAYTRFDPLAPFGAGGTWSFPPGAYRMQAPASPDPAGLGSQRLFSSRDPNDPVGFESNVFVDIVDWNPAVRTTIGMFRSLSDVGVGTTDGYFVGLIVGGGGPSQLAVFRIENEAATLAATSALPELTPDHDYRLAIPGEPGGFATGLAALVADIADLSTALGYVRLSDPGLPVSGGQLMALGTFGPYDSGSGAFLNAPLDATFDNFIAVPEPASAVVMLGGALLGARRRRL